MYRGTTPTLNFLFDMDLEQLNIAAFYLSFKQGNEIVLEKELQDLEIDKNKVSIQLTQQDTLKMNANNVVYIQGRIKVDNEAYATNIIKTTLSDILKEGEI